MKSIRWTFQALVVLLAVSNAACNKSSGGGSAPSNRPGQMRNGTVPRQTPYGLAPDGRPLNTMPVSQPSSDPSQNQSRSASAPGTPASANGKGQAPATTTETTSVSNVTLTEPLVSPLKAKASNIGATSRGGDSVLNAPMNLPTVAREATPVVTSLPVVSAPRSAVTAPEFDGGIRIQSPRALEASEQFRAGQQGPGWPKGDAASQQPILSGLVSAEGQAYTDGKDDSIMSVLVHKMNSMDANLRTDSEQLAMTVEKINLAVDRQIISLDLSFRFSDRTVEASFNGYLAPNQAATTLIQRSGIESFMVHITCADRVTTNGVTCRNAILMINQLKDGQVCRRIYAVHRWMFDGVGDGHLTLSKEEFELSTKIYEEDKAIKKAQKLNQPYEKPLIVKNRAYRAFLRLAGNTVHFNRLQNGEPVRLASDESIRLPRWPRFNFIGVRSWAVAYGPSFAEITMGQGKPGAKGQLRDTTRLAGLLTKPRVAGEVATSLAFEGEYSGAQVNDHYDERFAQALQKADLIDNDGRGHLTLQLEFNDSKEGLSSTRVNFNSLHLNVLSANELLRIVP